MTAKKPTAQQSPSWVGKVEKYSRKIWLAGLGVYSKIDTDGSSLFDSLVKEGEKAEKLTKAGEPKTAKSSTRSKVDDVKELALGKWSELEEAFDKRLNSAISRLGVPSSEEVKALHAKVETLTQHLEKLTAAAAKVAASKSPAASKPVPVKAAAKPAVAKPASRATAPAKPAAAKSAAAKPAVKPAAKPAVKPAAKAPSAPAKPAAKPAAAKVATKKPATRKKTTQPNATPAAATPPLEKTSS
ncbi:phasin family protein [Pseudomonas saxonica]|uniref:Phasin family protein n=1 Tax=Pseudomonas saxonica TaxID=2600598 RepID=A0A5C5PRL5_9PSED|nr:phasin family protein [Pseudomonas saxonica]TWR82788.1 phasin family protein [Pseudomonas saxonica]